MPRLRRHDRGARRLLAGLGPALCLAAACATPGADVAAPAPDPLLWLARPAEPGAGALYLLGSVHVLGGAGSFGRAVEAAYLRSDELVVEVDLSAVRKQDIAVLTARLGTLPEGETLRDQLSPETWRLLDAYLRESGLPAAYVTRLEPWVVATIVAVTELQRAGFQAAEGVDRSFLARASAGGKPIRELETPEAQLYLFDSLPRPLQDLMLKDMLARLDRVGEETAQLIAAWERGDEALLLEILLSPLDEYPELAPFYDAVYFDRNERMAAGLAELTRDGKTRFVVLGAGHMVGPRGVPALLAKRGFRVERVGGSPLPAAQDG